MLIVDLWKIYKLGKKPLDIRYCGSYATWEPENDPKFLEYGRLHNKVSFHWFFRFGRWIKKWYWFMVEGGS